MMEMDGQSESISWDRVIFASTTPGIEIASTAMPNAVQNGDIPPALEGLDIMDLTREDLLLGPARTPFLDAVEVKSRLLQARVGVRPEIASRLAELPMERAVRSVSPDAPPHGGQGDDSPSQTTGSRRVFSHYRNSSPAEAVYERLIAFDPARGCKVRWYQCRPEEDTWEPLEHLPRNFGGQVLSKPESFTPVFKLRRGV